MRICIVLLISVFLTMPVFADNGQEACKFFTHYQLYKNTPDTLADICSIYVNAAFYNVEVKDLVYSKNDNSIYIVTAVFSVGKPRPDVLEAAPPLAQKERMKVEDELRLEWLVDMRKRQVTPYNYLAQDCLNLYQEMCSVFGLIPERK